MAVVTITPPDSLVGSVLAKQHLRVDFDDDDTLIEVYVAAASAHIDGVGAYLGRAVGRQTLEWDVGSFDAIPGGCTFADPAPLPYGPASSIVSITFRDSSGGDQTLAEDLYDLAAGGLIFNSEARPIGESVRIRYVVGMAVTPKPIVAAVLLMVGDLYANRETVVVGSIAGSIPVSTTVENLLRPYRDLKV